MHLRGHLDALERRAGHDDRVPVAGGAAGHEGTAPFAFEVFALRREEFGLRVELEELAAELFEHVVGHHDRGLVHQAKPA